MEIRFSSELLDLFALAGASFRMEHIADSEPNVSITISLPALHACTELQNQRYSIKKVIFHDPATIVIWEDDTKTVVKCQPEDTYDKEKGLLLCYVKRMLGDTSRDLNDFLHEWVTE